MSWVSVLEVFLLNPRCFSAQVKARERKAPARQMWLPCCKEKAVVSQPNTLPAAVEQSVLERLGLKDVCPQEKSTACFVRQMQAN